MSLDILGLLDPSTFDSDSSSNSRVQFQEVLKLCATRIASISRQQFSNENIVEMVASKPLPIVHCSAGIGKINLDHTLIFAVFIISLQ
jgi:protein tyrosine phosphatase